MRDSISTHFLFLFLTSQSAFAIVDFLLLIVQFPVPDYPHESEWISVHALNHTILSLYVAPSFRHRGGATLMLNELKRLLFEHTSIQKIMIDYTVTHEEHKTLTAFLTASGFIKEDDFGLTLYKFPLEKILNSPLFSSSSKESSNILAFNKISDNLLVTAKKMDSVHNLPLPEVPLTSDELNRELSHAYIKNGEIEAFKIGNRWKIPKDSVIEYLKYK